MSRTKLGVALVAGLFAVGLSAPASALPTGASSAAVLQSSTSAVEKVHVRRYRHCHGPRGHRWCHGGYYGHGGGYGGYYPYYSPGINLYFGPGYRHRGYRGHHGGHHGGHH
jgi:hypothetical protein